MSCVKRETEMWRRLANHMSDVLVRAGTYEFARSITQGWELQFFTTSNAKVGAIAAP